MSERPTSDARTLSAGPVREGRAPTGASAPSPLAVTGRRCRSATPETRCPWLRESRGPADAGPLPGDGHVAVRARPRSIRLRALAATATALDLRRSPPTRAEASCAVGTPFPRCVAYRPEPPGRGARGGRWEDLRGAEMRQP